MPKKIDYPAVGDFVVASVKRITDYGAYVTLDEYNSMEGLIHVSEISTRWVRNIRDHLREGQKLVLKVLRINPKRSQVDLSLRRVTGREKIEKMLQWKMDKKAESILKGAAEKLNKSGVSMKRVKNKILEKYDSIYDAFEESLEVGKKVFTDLNIGQDWASTLTEVSKSKIKLEKVKVRGILEMSCPISNGVDIIKESMLKAQKSAPASRSRINIYTIGAPKYRIEVYADDYGEGERVLKRASEESISFLTSKKGVGRRID